MRPLIIIGAPRSGTNILRDVLCRLPGLGTWDCDEINPIWRHGNLEHPNDELRPDHATEEVRAFVQGAFVRLARRRGLKTVVEKTCANSLRVDFVRAILPRARFIWVIRDGRDATASAILRWKASVDLLYTLRKARYVPARDLPHYARSFLTNRWKKFRSRERRLATWGPRFEGMGRVLQEDGLEAACATQWVRCVESAERAFADSQGSDLLVVYHEKLVARPAEEMGRLAAFAGVEITREKEKEIVADITDRGVGRWKERLGERERRRVLPILDPVLRRFGYA